MVKLSKKTVDLLKDDVVSILYENSLKPLFTNEIAVLLRRDKGFVKRLLLELKELGVVENVGMNKRKKSYLLRQRWMIMPSVLKRFEERNFKG